MLSNAESLNKETKAHQASLNCMRESMASVNLLTHSQNFPRNFEFMSANGVLIFDNLGSVFF